MKNQIKQFKRITTILFIILQFNIASAQSEEEGIWLKAMNPIEQNIPEYIDGQFIFQDTTLNNLFYAFNLTHFDIAFPEIFKLPSDYWNGLNEVFEIRCECDINILYDSLILNYTNNYYSVELIPIYIPLSTSLEKQLEITCYPNPANEFLKVKIEGNQLIETAYSLHSIDGKVIETKRIGSSNFFEINLQALNAGVYFLKIYSGKNQENITYKKFVKV